MTTTLRLSVFQGIYLCYFLLVHLCSYLLECVCACVCRCIPYALVALFACDNNSFVEARRCLYVVSETAVFTLAILPDARTVRERFASDCPYTHCVHCVHCVRFVRYTQTTSGGVRSGRERYAATWRCSVNARVDASGSRTRPVRQRRAVCAYLQTNLIIFTTPLICNAANRARRNHGSVG